MHLWSSQIVMLQLSYILLFLQDVSLQITKLPHHLHAGGSAFFLLDIVPLGFVSTMLHISPHVH